MDLKDQLLQRIKANGGWVNAHAHLDRAYTIGNDNFYTVNAPLQDKWELNNELKQASSVEDIYDRMATGMENMIKQGVSAIGTFIDVDVYVKDKAIRAAQRIRGTFKGDLEIKYINQVHYGVIEREARYWFGVAAEFVDIIGGLPERDKGREGEHLDILFSKAKEKKKMAHIHIDQLNDPEQKDTELLVRKTIEHGLQGKVAGIHGISIGAQNAEYRQNLYKQMKAAGVMMIACPIGWIDIRRNETLMPFHNALTPVDEMIPAGITVAIGTDNIADIYKPFGTGDMWEELHVLLEASHHWNVNDMVDIATVNGREVLGLE